MNVINRDHSGVFLLCVSGALVGLFGCSVPDASDAADGGDLSDALPVDAAAPPADGRSVDAASADSGATDANIASVQAAPAFAAAVAVGPEQSFVVWVDERNTDLDIYGSRVDASGQILDPGGIPISIQVGNEHEPTVSWTGDHFLIAWMDRRGTGTRIYAARLATDGTLLDPMGIPLSPAGDFSQLPTVSSGPEGSLVVFEGPCGDQCTGVVAVAIDGNGNTGAVKVVAPTGREPSVASGAGGYLVAYTDYRNGTADVYAQKLQANASMSGAEIAVSVAPNAQLAPSVAGGDEGYLIAWVDTRNGILEHAWSLLNDDDNLGDAQFIASTPRWQDPPQTAFSDGMYQFVWTEESADLMEIETHLGRVPETGPGQGVDTVVDHTPLSVAAGDKKPSIHCTVAHCSIAWHQRFDTERTVVGIVLGADGLPVGGATTLWSTIMDE